MIVQRLYVGRCAFDGDYHDLIVFAEVFAGQRPHVHAPAVFRQEGGGFFGQVVQVDAPQCQAAVLQPLPTVAQVGKLDPFVGFGGFVVIVGWVELAYPKRAVGG